MKLLIAVVWDEDAQQAVPILVEKGLRVTRVASTGGFLRRGNTTLLIGVEDDRVQEAVDVLRGARKDSDLPGTGRGAVFVLNVERFEQI
ncbi:MAG TPA: cyclic-di-AMP receptor [Anaerolineales bacterium]|nr:cyclic-di-AMP receptor [Anaerolineales bacterium]